MTPVPLLVRHFKKRTLSAPKTAATATASRATVTMTPPTEVIQLVSSDWQNFSHLSSNTHTYTALICRRGVFVIMNRTMQICWCGSVTSNFLNLEMCKRPHAPVLLAGMKRPPEAPIPISHLGEREKTLGRIASPHSICQPAATVISAERTVTRGEVEVLPWRQTKSSLTGRKSHAS